MHYLSAVPGSGAVIAGVSEAGLWKSAEGGATWTKLGGEEVRSRPDRIVYDPRNPDIFWVSGCYGDAPFRTNVVGKTFRRLSRLGLYRKTVCGSPPRRILLRGLRKRGTVPDGFAVNFTDPAHLLDLRMSNRTTKPELSTEPRATWTKIGSRCGDKQTCLAAGKS